MAGLVTGAIGLVLSIALLVTVAVYLNRHSTEFRDFRDCVNRANTAADRGACADQLSNQLNYF
jgi:hypothetical protein